MQNRQDFGNQQYNKTLFLNALWKYADQWQGIFAGIRNADPEKFRENMRAASGTLDEIASTSKHLHMYADRHRRRVTVAREDRDRLKTITDGIQKIESENGSVEHFARRVRGIVKDSLPEKLQSTHGAELGNAESFMQQIDRRLEKKVPLGHKLKQAITNNESVAFDVPVDEFQIDSGNAGNTLQDQESTLVSVSDFAAPVDWNGEAIIESLYPSESNEEPAIENPPVLPTEQVAEPLTETSVYTSDQNNNANEEPTVENPPLPPSEPINDDSVYTPPIQNDNNNLEISVQPSGYSMYNDTDANPVSDVIGKDAFYPTIQPEWQPVEPPLSRTPIESSPIIQEPDRIITSLDRANEEYSRLQQQNQATTPTELEIFSERMAKNVRDLIEQNPDLSYDAAVIQANSDWTNFSNNLAAAQAAVDASGAALSQNPGDGLAELGHNLDKEAQALLINNPRMSWEEARNQVQSNFEEWAKTQPGSGGGTDNSTQEKIDAAVAASEEQARQEYEKIRQHEAEMAALTGEQMAIMNQIGAQAGFLAESAKKIWLKNQWMSASQASAQAAVEFSGSILSQDPSNGLAQLSHNLDLEAQAAVGTNPGLDWGSARNQAQMNFEEWAKTQPSGGDGGGTPDPNAQTAVPYTPAVAEIDPSWLN